MNTPEIAQFLPSKLEISIGGHFGAYYEVSLDNAMSGAVKYTTGKTLTEEELRERESRYIPPDETPFIKETLHDGKRLITEEVIPVDPGAWITFREALDALNVWKWKSEYQDEGCCDGTGWGVKIAYRGKELESGGCNCYPKANGSPGKTPDPTPTFEAFLKAVSTLIEGREFQ